MKSSFETPILDGTRNTPLPTTETQILHRDLEAIHPDCYGWALACCAGDRETAEDALQVAYLRVLDGKARFAGRSSFKTWVFGVIRRTSSEQSRKRFWRRVLSLEDASAADAHCAAMEEDPEQLAASSETSARLRRALRGLSERQQQVLHLVFYQDLTIEEAATVLGIGLGSARTHYARGKDKLRQRLLEEE